MNKLILALLLTFTLPTRAAELSCEQEIGKKYAQILVEWCEQTKHALNPACSIKDPCTTLAAEIRTGCYWILDSYNNKYLKNQPKPPFYCLITTEQGLH